MKLGPSLIGAVVGALVGVAAQIGLESSLGRETVWFALVVGLLTGLGARLMAGGAIARASFLRAGLAALVALAAIFGASYASSELTRKKSVEAYETAPLPPARTEVAAAPVVDEGEDSETTDPPADDDTGTEPAAETSAEGEEPAASATEETVDSTETADEPTPTVNTAPQLDPARRALSGEPQNLPRQPLNVWQLLCVTVGVLTAYELSRGGSRHS
ncbi:hypothetical protein [Aeoliella sp. SH292]|uniref:hypothetical protein n=1 Tax=Aeoliella sp. SH292 TaxID=3454464 RepID=UPI003F9BD51B